MEITAALHQALPLAVHHTVIRFKVAVVVAQVLWVAQAQPMCLQAMAGQGILVLSAELQ
jgi:hypothetical protein